MYQSLKNTMCVLPSKHILLIKYIYFFFFFNSVLQLSPSNSSTRRPSSPHELAQPRTPSTHWGDRGAGHPVPIPGEGAFQEAPPSLWSPNHSTAQCIQFSSPSHRRLLAPVQSDTDKSLQDRGIRLGNVERCQDADSWGLGQVRQVRVDHPHQQDRYCLPRRAELQHGSSRRPVSQPGTDLSSALA